MDKKERKRMANAASRARKKKEAGKELSDAEQTAIDSWEGMKKASGRPKKSSAPETPPEPPKEPATAPTSKTPAKPEAKAPEPEKAPRTIASGIMNRPPPSAPPQIFGKNRSKEAWQEKWKQAAGGREATCVEAATMWKTILLKAVKGIEEMDGKPVFDAEAIEKVIYPATVLTVDKLLPDSFETTPEVTMAFGSSITIAQHYLLSRRKKAEAAEKAQVDRSARKEVGDSKRDPKPKPDLKVVAKPSEEPRDVQLPPAQGRVVKEMPADDGTPLV